MPNASKIGPGDAYRRRHKLADVWRWATGHGPYRWKLALLWAEKHVKHSQDTERAHWEAVVKAYRKRHDAAVRHHKATGHDPHFEPYMLNGHPGNITSELKAAIARGVVIHKQFVTATTDGTHTPTSFHYPRNNASHGYTDDEGHAADLSSYADYGRSFFDAEKARGAENYDELFGPGDGYVKNGTLYPGPSPDVPNHCHCAPRHR